MTGRFEERLLNGDRGILINDCYNANPESMKAALLAFQQIETNDQKLLFLVICLDWGLIVHFGIDN